MINFVSFFGHLLVVVLLVLVADKSAADGDQFYLSFLPLYLVFGFVGLFSSLFLSSYSLSFLICCRFLASLLFFLFDVIFLLILLLFFSFMLFSRLAVLSLPYHFSSCSIKSLIKIKFPNSRLSTLNTKRLVSCPLYHVTTHKNTQTITFLIHKVLIHAKINNLKNPI